MVLLISNEGFVLNNKLIGKNAPMAPFRAKMRKLEIIELKSIALHPYSITSIKQEFIELKRIAETHPYSILMGE